MIGLKLPLVAAATLVLTISSVGGVAASVDQSSQLSDVEAALDDSASFVLIASPGESFAAAVSRQLTNSPEQAGAIAAVLDEMDSLDQPIPIGATMMSAAEIDVAREAFDLELAQAGSGQQLAEEISPSNLALDVVRAPAESTAAADVGPTNRLLSNPSFTGRQQIQAFICTSQGCVLQSTRVHDSRIDLGFTTAIVNGKTSGGGGWIVTAIGSCQRGSSSCGTKSFPKQSTFGPGTTWTFTSSIHRAKIEVTFAGTWFGIPGTVTGATPSITCVGGSFPSCKFD